MMKDIRSVSRIILYHFRGIISLISGVSGIDIGSLGKETGLCGVSGVVG